MKEVYKDIVGYEGIYQVSNLGNVKALPCWKYRGNGKQFRGEQILKPKLTYNGYLQVCLCRNGERRFIGIHRLVASAFLPNIENKATVNHIDGNKLNNEVSNLAWATNKEQITHADSNGLRNIKGENHKRSKLNWLDVLAIRQSTLSLSELSRIYNVNKTCISKVKTYKSWKHI